MKIQPGMNAATEESLNALVTQDLLQVSVERYREIMQLLPIAMYTTDEEGYITLYNPAAVELWGREPILHKDKWCGSWKMFDLDGSELPPDQGPMALSLRERKAVPVQEIIIERPDGSRRHVMPHSQLIIDQSGNITGAFNMLVDITSAKTSELTLRTMASSLEKKVAERTADLQAKTEELRKSEERYHKMIDEVEDYAILLMDKSGIIQNWNRGAEKIKGYKEHEIVGKNFRVFYLPDDQERGLPDRLIAEATLKGKALHEGWRVRKDRSIFWGSIVITALHDTDNNVIGFSKVTRDLTERKIAEDKIRQYTNNLEFQNKELEQFAYAAAHDMKEPLRKIRFYSNLVFENSSSRLPEKELEYLKRSINAAARMQNLIDDLLTYSKTSSQEQEVKPVDLGQVVAEVLVAHGDTIRDLRAEIETGNLPVVAGVRFQVNQLFDNLISNALKYHHPDRPPHIRISAELISGAGSGIEFADEQKEYYKITVADNGTGFDSLYADKVFDLFQRLHDKVNYSGTGIGLALCRRIVQNHHGFILACGEEGQGATFTVYFPVAESK